MNNQMEIPIDLLSIPKHICITMDGNRRWAKANNQAVRFGHLQGAERAVQIAKFAKELGIQTLTLYAFSTENWRRSSNEVRSLMSIFRLFIYKMRKEMINHGIRLETIGDLSPFPAGLKKSINKAKELTCDGAKMKLVLALNYGGRAEICRAALKMAAMYADGMITSQDFTESRFAAFLDSHQCCDPDLLIRTSGEQRISNFLLWQISYSELYFTNVLWPNFTKNDLLLAIKYYQERDRRIGR